MNQAYDVRLYSGLYIAREFFSHMNFEISGLLCAK